MYEHCRGCIRYLKSCGGMTKEVCERYQLRIPRTNADRIRHGRDEELAHILWLTANGGIIGRRSEDEWLDWLKEEAKDAD